jgi:hypothetical protein
MIDSLGSGEMMSETLSQTALRKNKKEDKRKICYLLIGITDLCRVIVIGSSGWILSSA